MKVSLITLYKDWLGKAPEDSQQKELSRWMKPKLWRGIGFSDQRLWGEVKTKGSLFYKVILDKGNQTQGCTCAQVVSPCPHALALLTGWHEGVLEASTEAIPSWAEGNLNAKSTTKVIKELSTSLSVSEQRLGEMKAGYIFLQTWLVDQTREGWRRTLDPPATHLEEVAARLVNDRLPGPARLLRSLLLPPTLVESNNARFQTHISVLTLASRLFLQGSEHHPITWPHLLQFSGITLRKDQIRKHEPVVEDHWIRLAQQEEEADDGLHQRTTWLYGIHHQRFALVLDFAWKRQPLPPALPNHPVLKGTMTFYPGRQNLRAIQGDLDKSNTNHALQPAYSNWSIFFDWLITFRTVDPFTSSIPVWVEGHFLQQDNETLAWSDHEGRQLPLGCTPSQSEFLHTFLGIPKLSLFGLFYAHRFQPLALFSEGQQIPLI